MFEHSYVALRNVITTKNVINPHHNDLCYYSLRRDQHDI